MILLDYMDTDGDGFVNYDEFLKSIRVRIVLMTVIGKSKSKKTSFHRQSILQI
jgi:hypothetical protein